MERTIISWTPENWFTVLLMVAIGFAAYAALARVAHKARSK